MQELWHEIGATKEEVTFMTSYFTFCFESDGLAEWLGGLADKSSKLLKEKKQGKNYCIFKINNIYFIDH